MAHFSSLPSPSLSEAIDDHVAWFAAWCRLAMPSISAKLRHKTELSSPESLKAWLREAPHGLLFDQPMLDRLSLQHEQLHKLAKLILIKTADGDSLSVEDYDSVSSRYLEFMENLRKVERAFQAAASGLDNLTGLRSRVGMMEELKREQERFKRTGKTFCLAIMDLDHFKKINDTFGHEAGDRVLAAAADHISQSLRVSDDAYRMGGEEFLLCLKDVDLGIGFGVLERLRASLAAMPVVFPDGREAKVTASFGITVSTRDISIEALTKKADQALYRAKEEGRNRIIAG